MMSGSIIIDHRNVIRLIIMNKQIEIIKKKEREKKKKKRKPNLSWLIANLLNIKLLLQAFFRP